MVRRRRQLSVDLGAGTGVMQDVPGAGRFVRVVSPSSNFGLLPAPQATAPDVVSLDSREDSRTAHEAGLDIVLRGPAGPVTVVALSTRQGELLPELSDANARCDGTGGPVYKVLGTSEAIDLKAQQAVVFHAEVAMGTTRAVAGGLALASCLVDTQTKAVSLVDTAQEGLRVLGRSRHQFSLSSFYRSKVAQTVEVGVCGCVRTADDVPHWDHNGHFKVMTMVLAPDAALKTSSAAPQVLRQRRAR